MKNVLNSFEFTFATCKDMLMRMFLLTDINIYYLITKKKIYIYIYIYLLHCPETKAANQVCPIYLSRFPKKKNPMSVYLSVGANCFKA